MTRFHDKSSPRIGGTALWKGGAPKGATLGIALIIVLRLTLIMYLN